MKHGNSNARGEGNGTKLGRYARNSGQGYDVYGSMGTSARGVRKKKSGKKGMVKY